MHSPNGLRPIPNKTLTGVALPGSSTVPGLCNRPLSGFTLMAASTRTRVRPGQVRIDQRAGRRQSGDMNEAPQIPRCNITTDEPAVRQVDQPHVNGDRSLCH
jgi:hypothetical protein